MEDEKNTSEGEITDASVANRVEAMTKGSLYGKTEKKVLNVEDLPPDAIAAHGLINIFVYSKDKLQRYKEDYLKLMDYVLGDEFLVKDARFDPLGPPPPDSSNLAHGCGHSFLMLPFIKSDPNRQWGEHYNAEVFFCLGLGLGLAQYTFARNMWSTLPAGMPYVAFSKTGEFHPSLPLDFFSGKDLNTR